MAKYELLAPAGDFTNLRVAVDSGADAVYFGLKEFSLRSNARNFELEELDEIDKICKEKNVKKYLTLNSIIYTEELPRLEEIIKKIKGKVDAVICWDLSVISLCKKYGVPFHISTQGSVSNVEAAKFYKDLGADRIVFARELSLLQIKEIIDKVGIEGETFIHGAMCLAISGRCFMSHFLFDKSANRGECSQPCRREYIIKDTQEGKEMKISNNHVLSPKDLCTLPFIEELKKSGITSFKIEGRNKDPRYVETVVRVYRKALDNKLSEKEIEELEEELRKVYNKGLSSGFYTGKPTNEDFSKVQHSAATTKKHFVGKVKKYLPKIKVAIINLVSDLKKGDEVSIIGKKTGVVNTKIDSIEMNKKIIDSGNKGDEVGIKINSEIKKDDDAYVIKNKN